jgi:hypothetical protein
MELDKLLKQKENEIKLMKKKEQTYQSLIYTLAKELGELKKSNGRTTDREETEYFTSRIMKY